MSVSDSGELELSPQVRRVTVDERNTHSFRVAHRTSSNPRQPSRSEGPTQYQLLSRLRSVLNDAVAYVRGHPQDEGVIDHFTGVCDDAVKDLKQLKIENRAARTRRQPCDVSTESVDAAVTDSPAKRKRHADPNAHSSPRPEAKRETAWSRPLNLRSSADVDDKVREASRSLERQADAEARRKLLAAERQQRLESAAERSADARARRGAAEQRIRDDTAHKLERASTHHARQVEGKREFAAKDVSRVDEAGLVRAGEAQNLALEIEERHRATDRNAEQLAQARQQQAKERDGAREQVLSRAKSAERQRLEAHASRVQAKEEQRQRHEAVRKKESEEKQQRVEERRGRVQEQQARAQAEAEAKFTRANERFEASEKVREELASKLKEKAEQQEAKIKEAKERRDREAGRPKFLEFMEPREAAAVAKCAEVVARCVALCQRHAKPFLDEATLPPASTKAKLRATMARFASNQGNPAQYRQPLHDLHAAIDGSSSAEVGALRCATGVPVLVDVLIRTKPDSTCSRLLTETLLRFVTHRSDATKNIEFFVRSGCLGRFIEVVHEELKKATRQSMSPALTLSMTLLFNAADYVLFDGRDKPYLQSYRQMLFDLFSALDVSNYTLALAMVAQAEDMQVLQASLALVRCFYTAAAPNVAEQLTRENHDRMCHSLMTCIANMLMPGGLQLKPEHSISPAASGVLFLALRLLNDIARCDLRFLQAQVSDPATSMVFGHVVTAVCGYVSNHEAELESMPSDEIDSRLVGPSTSFVEAMRAGVTYGRFPRVGALGKRSTAFLRAAFHELLLLTGYIAVNNSVVQDVFAYGRDSALLCQLIAALPVAYFGVSKHIAFPSLLAICYGHNHNLSILRGEMDAEALTDFLEAEIDMHGIPEASIMGAKAQHAPISWADLMDDDDTDQMFADVGATHGDEQPQHAAAITPSDKAEHMANAVASRQAVPYACFFRFDKRFAPELWRDAASLLAHPQ